MNKYTPWVLGLALLLSSCGSLGGNPGDEINRRPPPPPYKDPWFNPVWDSPDNQALQDFNELKPVPFWVPSYDPQNLLIQELDNHPVIEITREAYLKNFPRGDSLMTGFDPPKIEFKADHHYFLVRACVYFPVVTSVRVKNGLVVISSFIMTSGYPQPRRGVLILDLDQAPRQVYVRLSAAS